MELDLERLLEATRKGQWSVHDFDWTAPLGGVEGLSRRKLKEAGLALLFTAGLERQAAKVFRLNAEHVDDPTAAKIFELFAVDELRHADAEVRLAKRLGAEWEDLPLASRMFFKSTSGDWRKLGRNAYAINSAVIILFELALDSILVHTLKSLIDDPLQKEVFRRIDQDESRHLAMDYWLLNRRGERREKRAPMSWRGIQMLTRSLPILPFSVIAYLQQTRGLQSAIQPEALRNYYRKVTQVPRKAPHAMKVPEYRNAVAFLQKSTRYVAANPRMFRGVTGIKRQAAPVRR